MIILLYNINITASILENKNNRNNNNKYNKKYAIIIVIMRILPIKLAVTIQIKILRGMIIKSISI